jgi:predicted amidohydrolase YtcJ
VTNATIYTVDEAFDTATAMAISGGKIIAIVMMKLRTL